MRKEPNERGGESDAFWLVVVVLATVLIAAAAGFVITADELGGRIGHLGWQP